MSVRVWSGASSKEKDAWEQVSHMYGAHSVGVAARGALRRDAVEHLLVPADRRPQWSTWCGGGPAYDSRAASSRRFCGRCMALAVEMVEELG